jgi:phosphohistidine phosphatase
MKRLVLIRHAKTEHIGYERDFERELTHRGISDIEKITEDLKEWKIFPDTILSSPAQRALATARILAGGLDFSLDKITQIKELYFEMTTTNFLNRIRKTDVHIETLFVVGHNPFMHYVAQKLSADYDGHMPTSSTVVLDFTIDSWEELEAGKGILFLHLYPKIYK